MMSEFTYQRVSILMLVTFFIVNISCTSQKIQFSCGFSEDTKMAINHLQSFVDAMEKYRNDHGRYPKEPWKELIPKYTDSIPVLNCSESTSGLLPIHNVLQNKNLCDRPGLLPEDGQSFSRKFTTNDERICLFGRNNICEYTSETKEWKCYMH